MVSPKMCMARVTGASDMIVLLLMLTHTFVVLLIYTSAFASLCGTLKMRGLACSNGVYYGRYLGYLMLG